MSIINPSKIDITMKKQYISPALWVFNIHTEDALAMSLTIDGEKQAEQWTQQKGWCEEDRASNVNGDQEEQGYW